MEIIDIEMQTSNKEDDWLSKRARYYGSMLDLSSLAKGKDYVEIKNSMVSNTQKNPQFISQRYKRREMNCGYG